MTHVHVEVGRSIRNVVGVGREVSDYDVILLSAS